MDALLAVQCSGSHPLATMVLLDFPTVTLCGHDLMDSLRVYIAQTNIRKQTETSRQKL